MTDLPAPLVAADVDLRDFAFMPLDVGRLLTSETWLLGSGDECKAAMALWCVSWHQVPAASLPANDKMLAHLSAAGPRWRKVKAHALRGWVLCADGRMYHPVVAEKAIEAWGHKRKQSERGKAGAAKRWSGDSGGNGASNGTGNADANGAANASAMLAPMLGDSKGPDRDQTRQGPDQNPEGGGAPPSPPGRSLALAHPQPEADLLAIPPSLERRRATRLPEGWVLPDEWRHRAVDARHRHGMPAINLDLEAEKFANYWRAQPGAKGTKLDWAATWQNWALRADGSGRHVNGAAQMDPAELERELDRRMGVR